MSSVATWPSRAESWLDQRGKGAWIVAMVLGFILFWPIGLAILFYMIWSNRMFTGRRKSDSTYNVCIRANRMKTTGNTAFDAYKAETLRRLEDEQQAFEDFLDRLRQAKDKAEFDQFMEDRARKARESADAAAANPAGA
ncbi:hypothetical protein Ga0609869_000070 [Rhodovulum iodosum]|uniref:DUF2852 domain-containing protein n=1 Tax=Rhodovulum iodosum TaxID=68291 RepID=A0ABV3XQJ2_9RHOB|nr:DUF2852 domain-containing protein [Rhodovulum robiginosum]RSK35854.1 DUF2852 domain-containing protein [Rhodovulum robiginosum]